MKQVLVITATLTLPSDPLAASKLQTAALEAGAVFQKAIIAVDKKAEYGAKVSRVREETDPPVTRKGKTAGADGDKKDGE